MRREKQKAKVEDEDDAEDDKRDSKSVLAVSSDDDEAKEDLSHKLVEKALLMRAAKLGPNGDELGDGSLIDSSYWESEFVVEPNNDGLNGPSGFAASEVVDFNKGEIKMEIEKQMVIREEGQKTVETIKPRQKNEPAEGSMVQMSDNIVLQKLLRGPRYFDPPDSCWGTCYNCGKEGHTAVNCIAEKRKKPCFVCGNLEHSAKQCSMARNCFICKKGGHHAKDCPEKYRSGSKSPTICLKCGNSGHDMFSCKYNYSLDDLKDIQCYICKRFGHLCCVDSDDASPIEVSCYKCGQLGHTGLACSRLLEKATRAATRSCYKCGEDSHFSWECTSSAKIQACSRLHWEVTGADMPISCFKCGEEGHFSWECTSSAEAREEASALLSCYKCGEEGHFAWECTIL